MRKTGREIDNLCPALFDPHFVARRTLHRRREDRYDFAAYGAIGAGARFECTPAPIPRGKEVTHVAAITANVIHHSPADRSEDLLLMD